VNAQTDTAGGFDNPNRTDRLEANRIWSNAIIQRIDPSFRHRWEVFNDLLVQMLDEHTVWIDVGCGDNNLVETFGSHAQRAVGIDPLDPVGGTPAPFIKADITALPFEDNSVDVVTLRFVVEHLRRIPEDFAEVARVLRPGGRVLSVTTNTWSPFVFPLRLLPFGLKNLLIRSLLRVEERDIFPTYHRFNTPRRMRRGAGRLQLQRLILVQDCNFTRRWLFVCLFGIHLLTRPAVLQGLRPNLVAVLQKT
jgi:SAM-dependent methyltransferase